MSGPKTALDLAKKWEATNPVVCSRPGVIEESREWGQSLDAIPADAVKQIEQLTRDAKAADQQWQSAMSRIAHICRLLGVDFCCEEPETCEQAIERLKRQLYEANVAGARVTEAYKALRERKPLGRADAPMEPYDVADWPYPPEWDAERKYREGQGGDGGL